MPMTDAEIYEFDLHGMIVYRNVLSPEQVRECNRLVDGFVKDDNTFGFDFFTRDPFFVELMALPRTLDILRTMLGEWYRLDHAYGIQMHDQGPDNTNLHGGPRTDQNEHCYQWHQGRMYNGLVVVAYALADVNPGDGGFVGVPGSHKANHPYKPEPGSPLVSQPAMKAGDMLIFTEALVHGTRQWRSPNRRRSLLYKYSPGFSTWSNLTNAEWPAKATAMATTDLQRALLRPPFVGNRPALPFPPA
jgi:hypothetical protein